MKTFTLLVLLLLVPQLAAAGVKRISVGASFARAAYGAFVTAANEVMNDGSFGYADSAIGFAEMNAFFKRGDSDQ